MVACSAADEGNPAGAQGAEDVGDADGVEECCVGVGNDGEIEGVVGVWERPSVPLLGEEALDVEAGPVGLFAECIDTRRIGSSTWTRSSLALASSRAKPPSFPSKTPEAALQVDLFEEVGGEFRVVPLRPEDGSEKGGGGGEGKCACDHG